MPDRVRLKWVPYGHCDRIENSNGDWLPHVNYAASKTGLISWFVSHCVTPSRRERYVRQLGNLVPITIHGKCFNSTPTCGGNSRKKRLCAEASDVINSHKFYLAMENSLCDDYISEKLFKILNPGTYSVPIVYGAVVTIPCCRPNLTLTSQTSSHPRLWRTICCF